MAEDTEKHKSVLELRYGRTRCFLIHGKLLIDTDWAGTLPAYLACLQKHGIRAEDVSYLLITHYHPDHCGIAADLMALGATLLVMDVQKDAVHQSDPVFLQDHRHPFTPIPDEGTILLPCGDSRQFLKSIGISGEILATPGHSPDSVSLLLDDEQMAFVGDLPPLEQVPYYKDPILQHSVDTILAHGVRTLCYSHEPAQRVNRTE